tara:strand:+ start:7795 stop:8196 length:402 start_codon:yes stop_codon:yes gene_type:complete
MKKKYSNTFPKSQKLNSKKDIELLFGSHATKSISKGLLARWILFEERNLQSKYLIIVPKKRIAKAVLRNYIKRCMREGIRKNKGPFEEYLSQKGQYIHLAFIYQNENPIRASDIEELMKKGIKKVWHELETNY